MAAGAAAVGGLLVGASPPLVSWVAAKSRQWLRMQRWPRCAAVWWLLMLTTRLELDFDQYFFNSMAQLSKCWLGSLKRFAGGCGTSPLESALLGALSEGSAQKMFLSGQEMISNRQIPGRSLLCFERRLAGQLSTVLKR